MKRVVKIVINQTLKTKNKSNVKKTPMTKSNWVEKIPSNLWVLISLVVAIVIWTILSIIPNTSRSFPNIFYVSESVVTMMQRGVFWSDIASSLISVLVGFLIGFVISLPVAVLMAWYRPIRFIIEPWIQFVRNIPL